MTDIRWTDNLMCNMISSVSFVIGGNSQDWWCNECGSFKSHTEPENETMCGKDVHTLDQGKTKENFIVAFYKNMEREPTEDEIDHNYDYRYVDEDEYEKVYNIHICQSTEYTYGKEGITVDNYDGDWLNMWAKFSITNEND